MTFLTCAICLVAVNLAVLLLGRPKLLTAQAALIDLCLVMTMLQPDFFMDDLVLSQTGRIPARIVLAGVLAVAALASLMVLGARKPAFDDPHHRDAFTWLIRNYVLVIAACAVAFGLVSAMVLLS